tara:strand:- start:35 stop:625 length:591 start_codon:yes stop_codon:yes gene_type:complete
MAREIIDNGTVAGDNTGEILFDAFAKVNNNSEELYNVAGWGTYVDGQTAPATQTINTVESVMLVDGLASSSNSDYLPREIRGVSELWDGVDTFTPISIGDSYDVRITITVTGKTASPNVIDVILDIGVGAGVTIPVAQLQIPVVSSVPFTVTGSIPVFCLGTFKTNGGRIFLKTDAGTLTLSTRSVFIKRDYSGNL